MPTTPQVNTQQVLQMGTHTEKVQQTTQSIGNVTAQQLDKEREVVDEIKRNQVHETNITYFVEETDPKTRSKKRVRVQKKQAHQEEENIESDKPAISPEDNHGGKINIRA